jgi:ATP-dependent RNA helicase RhlE
MSFDTLGLAEPLLRAVQEEGYTTPTPIQTDAIPHVLVGRDLLGCAQTGTGKTAAFALPILHRLAAEGKRVRPRRPRVLILTPTRELAIQIDTSFRTYGRHTTLKAAVVYGGVGQGPQVQALARGVDVLTATPGRLLALIDQGHIELGDLTVFVLDEADRMLDMGFLPDVRRVIAMLPSQRQSLFFSATLPPSIVELAGRILTQPVHVEVTPESTTADNVVQRVVFVDQVGKRDLIAEIVRDPRVRRALVFTRTKHGANRVVERLNKAGIAALGIHGNKSQGARTRALEQFRSGETPILVATDLAARGLDVDGITHVINYDLPNEAESYVHRIGRTARAGASGMALSFCDTSEIGYLRGIERLIGQRIQVAGDRIGVSSDVRSPPANVSEGRRSSTPDTTRRPSSSRGGPRRGGGGGRGGPRR